MEDKIKIFYNEEGWVCNRYPNDIPVTDETRFIEVDEAEANKTICAQSGYAWRVVDGTLINEVYDKPEVDKQDKQAQIYALKAELAKIKEDIEQEAFGLIRDDYAGKKARAAEIVNELRVLEGKEPRKILL